MLILNNEIQTKENPGCVPEGLLTLLILIGTYAFRITFSKVAR